MTTTDVDITNRALQLIGTRTTVTTMGESSNEAIQANLVYNAVRDWCFGVSNWNFARKVVSLTVGKQFTGAAGTWSSTVPQPPWKYEYKLPADFIRAIYLTNSAHATTQAYDGDPQRFSFGNDTITAVVQQVILTNESPAILIYTAQITDPTLWPWYFERFMVGTLAWTLSMTLSGDKELVAYLDNVAMRMFTIAEQKNREEGLSFGDKTPEWIQAIGVPYPHFRTDPKMHDLMAGQMKAKQDGNQQR